MQYHTISDTSNSTCNTSYTISNISNSIGNISYSICNTSNTKCNILFRSGSRLQLIRASTCRDHLPVFLQFEYNVHATVIPPTPSWNHADIVACIMDGSQRREFLLALDWKIRDIPTDTWTKCILLNTPDLTYQLFGDVLLETAREFLAKHDHPTTPIKKVLQIE